MYSECVGLVFNKNAHTIPYYLYINIKHLGIRAEDYNKYFLKLSLGPNMCILDPRLSIDISV